MAQGIFINYRRSDEPGFAGRLYDRLEQALPDHRLFMDVDKIRGGENFEAVLARELEQCSVLLAIIGPQWLATSSAEGGRRLDHPQDFVRQEIERALQDGKRVIPVLVRGATMPTVNDLPPSMSNLAACQALRVSHDRFTADIAGLVREVRGAVAAVAAQHEARQAAEQRRREAEEERRRQQEQARKLEAERRSLSPEHLMKAEALAHWEFIKDHDDPDELRVHLTRFPDELSARMARRKLETLVWKRARAANSEAELAAFLEEFPNSAHADRARRLLDRIRSRTGLTEPRHIVRQFGLGMGCGLAALLGVSAVVALVVVSVWSPIEEVPLYVEVPETPTLERPVEVPTGPSSSTTSPLNEQPKPTQVARPRPEPDPAPVAAPPEPTQVARPRPKPQPAPVATRPTPVAAPLPAPTPVPVQSPDFRGLWLGAADGRSFKLTVRGQTGAAFRGILERQLDDGSWVQLGMEGRVDPDGALTFSAGDERYIGRVAGMRATGTFTTMPGTTLKSWSIIDAD